jgi:hypothetical protein
MERPSYLPTGGFVLDALGYPKRLSLEAYITWEMEAEDVWVATGWHPTWLAKSRVGDVEVSTIFLAMRGRLADQPFETWVKGPGRSHFSRCDTAQEAWAGHWCLVWQFWVRGEEG